MAKWKELPPSPEAIVKAALERAAYACSPSTPDGWPEKYRRGYLWAADDLQLYIRRLASDPAEVAAIIKKAGGIGDE
jgi:hypothetical protein